MDVMHAMLYGALEGVTEFLPISSTGHLMLLTEVLKLEQTEFLKSFEVIIQLGAILAVISVYPRRLFTDRNTVLNIMIAFIPTVILGFLAYDVIKAYLMESTTVVLTALLVGGVAIIALERLWKGRASGVEIAHMTRMQALFVGCTQCLAFIPGVSRSGATIFGAMGLGLSRKGAVEFSFLLAVPTMGSATALDLYRNIHAFTWENAGLLAVGFVTAFLVALIVIKWLARFIEQHDFTIFGYYRIVLATLGYMLLMY